MIAAGSFQATRTTGTVSVCEIACNSGATSFISEVPCWRSTHRASKPWRAMTSAVRPCETETQPRVGHLPAFHICLILFWRMVALSRFRAHHRPIDGAEHCNFLELRTGLSPRDIAGL